MPSKVPPILEPKLFHFHKHFSDLKEPWAEAVQHLLLTSDYALRHSEIISELLGEDLKKPPSFAQYQQDLLTISSKSMLPMTFLRKFRHRALLRLLLLENAQCASQVEIMRSWSDCADAIILYALQHCQQEFISRFGLPYDEDTGKVSELFVLAMGKLGGHELNFSSDVDLIFAFSSGGHTRGPESISNQQYFSKVVQLFLQLMQTVTAEGFVFRVDLRLRPNGESGALVSSLAAMETYYQEQGRDWERYAMVKARVIHQPSQPIPAWYYQLMVPFVYRRYVDYSVIEPLRGMKAMIEREIQRDPRLDDIKRGLGGIREIEFIVQHVQLIRGGRLPQLREQNLLTVLRVLQEEGLLSRAKILKNAYLFLRKLENALQSQNDQQTHSLPKEELKQAQIAFALGYDNWSTLLNKLQKYQRIVRYCFRSVLDKSSEGENEQQLIHQQLLNLWQGHIESTMAANTLALLGFDNASRCYQLLQAFRHSPRCKRLTQVARLHLDRFMVLLLKEISAFSNTDEVLLNVIHLLEQIVGRSAYLALLTENPEVVKELLHWFSKSTFVTDLLVTQPFLLEMLLQPPQLGQLASSAQLKKELKHLLKMNPEPELQEDLIRQFKLKQWFLAARFQGNKTSEALRIGRFLSDVAEVIVVEILNLACQQLETRYPSILGLKDDFAIIAYGKLGSREMNFNSDLDLVFVHAAGADERLITRLTQKILHMLTVRSQGGILYSVDTRLRPSGSAGLLVSQMDAFADYQRSKAWTWEHQALIRGRVVFGSPIARQGFYQLKDEVLSLKRDTVCLYEEVQAMRLKLNRYQDANQIKYGFGGLLDLEFLVQWLVLANPSKALLSYTNTLDLLHILNREQIISKAQFKILKKAYTHYHYCLQQAVLHGDSLETGVLHNKVREVQHALEENLPKRLKQDKL